MQLTLTETDAYLISKKNVKDVLARLQTGDEEVFEAWVQAHQGSLFRLLVRLTGDPDEALDLVQDTFLRALQGLSTFRGDASFRTWLHRIGVNAFMNGRRGQHHVVSIDTLETLISASSSIWQRRVPTPEELFSNRELCVRLGRVMMQLPPEHRVVLLLRDREGYGNQEVADLLGLSVPAVKSRLHRARLFLRQEMLAVC